MAELQGNLELVALPEVLRLLADKSSTGVLTIQGDATGWIYLEDGLVRFATTRQAEPAEATDQMRDQIVSVLVRLTRTSGGEFQFEGGDLQETPGDESFEIGPLVTDADRQVAEWREIEALIPSVGSELTMATDVSDDATITLGGRSWRVLATLSSSGTIREVASSLGVFEIDAARSLAQMVRDGLIEVGDEHLTPDMRFAAGGRIFETEAPAIIAAADEQVQSAEEGDDEFESRLGDGLEVDEDSALARRWREMQARSARSS